MAEKYLGQLTAKSAPATGDILVLEDSEDTKKIDYDALANAILNKLTTKTYTVAGGTNTLIAAIDALNSKRGNFECIYSNVITAGQSDEVTLSIRSAYLIASSGQAVITGNLWFVYSGGVGAQISELFKNTSGSISANGVVLTLTNDHSVQNINFCIYKLL